MKSNQAAIDLDEQGNIFLQKQHIITEPYTI